MLDIGIKFYLKGNLSEAYEIVSRLERGFVKKRLINEVANARLSSHDAVRIWGIAFSDSSDKFKEEMANALQNSGKIKKEKIAILSQTDTIKHASLPKSRRIHIEYPDEYLAWIKTINDDLVSIDSFEMAQPWGLAGIAALARNKLSHPIKIELLGTSPNGRFASALGLPELIKGDKPTRRPEQGRTVKMCCVDKFGDIEPAAYEISNLLVDVNSRDESEKITYLDPEETRKTIYYVIVELLRNVIQHSQDQIGAVVVAQNMSKERADSNDQKIQVAVVDTGIGIFRALKAMHEEITTPEVALERSIWPHFSGAFDKTKKGTSQNAGLGLFFVSEMAKLTAGTLMIATRGATLIIKGDPEGEGNNHISTSNEEFPGTLVVFELPRRGVADHDCLIRTIIDRAEERSAKRSQKTWIEYDDIPEKVYEVSVEGVVENTVEAEKFSKTLLLPRLEKHIPVAIDFKGIRICTQSFMHALLFDSLRVAVKSKTKIYAKNVTPTVKDGLRLLQIYAIDEE